MASRCLLSHRSLGLDWLRSDHSWRLTFDRAGGCCCFQSPASFARFDSVAPGKVCSHSYCCWSYYSSTFTFHSLVKTGLVDRIQVVDHSHGGDSSDCFYLYSSYRYHSQLLVIGFQIILNCSSLLFYWVVGLGYLSRFVRRPCFSLILSYYSRIGF